MASWKGWSNFLKHFSYQTITPLWFWMVLSYVLSCDFLFAKLNWGVCWGAVNKLNHQMKQKFTVNLTWQALHLQNNHTDTMIQNYQGKQNTSTTSTPTPWYTHRRAIETLPTLSHSLHDTGSQQQTQNFQRYHTHIMIQAHKPRHNISNTSMLIPIYRHTWSKEKTFQQHTCTYPKGK